MLVTGNLMQAARDASEDEEDGSFRAPPSWQLVRRRGDGPFEVVARGVTCFDLGEDGAVAWSDGCSIFHLIPGGEARRCARAPQAEQLVLLG